jgi:hypothetical protein
MRVLAVTMALLAVLASPAHAQMGGGKRGQRNNDNTNQADHKKAKADEKAYQDALKRIPEPWFPSRLVHSPHRPLVRVVARAARQVKPLRPRNVEIK